MHDVGMIESPHQFYLILKWLLAFISWELFLFRKSFDCHHFFIS